MFFRGNFLKSAHWIVLQRPVEPAGQIGSWLSSESVSLEKLLFLNIFPRMAAPSGE
jgi:hypothetical protein